VHEYEEAIARVAARAGLDAARARAMVGVPKERDRADLTLPCFAFSKATGKKPDEVAAAVAAAFVAEEMADE
jgi:arginyl-tRNA synthetase